MGQNILQFKLLGFFLDLTLFSFKNWENINYCFWILGLNQKVKILEIIYISIFSNLEFLVNFFFQDL